MTFWFHTCFRAFPHARHPNRRRIATAALIAAGFLFLLKGFVSAQEKNLAELMPRIPPKSIDEALKSFKLEQGFSLELVAAEPDVVDPIDAAFDEQGRMYVVEMNDYPFLPEQRTQKYLDQRKETWGRIRLLTDTNGDGKMDKSVIFANQLRWPQSVVCSKGGVFVLTPPFLLYLKDTTGDGISDTREVICSGFNTTNVQGLSNGLEWGRDNAIYFSSGLSGGELTVPARNNKPEYKFTPGRRDLRLDPETFELTMVAGGQQYGHTIDDWGARFICSNSNHIVHVTWPLHYLERNPLLTIPELTRSIAKEGAAAVVFRTSGAEPWRLVRTARRAADPEMKKKLPPMELVPIGFFTSATGVTVYRGGAYPPEFQGDVFVGDVGGNLVHRKKLVTNGISYIAERADTDVEFLTSTDNWFRPANFVNAPDGTLYVLDMYRETIEHPFSIPEDIKALVDLESGYDKGRIWRLVPSNYHRTTPPNLAVASTKELVASLGSPHGWIRDTAQRLIVERKDASATEEIRSLLASGSISGTTTSPQSRLHALWTLQGLKALRGTDIRTALGDPNERVREHALRLVPQYIGELNELGTVAMSLVQDPSTRVRWQLAFTFGDLPAKFAVPGLKLIARGAASDPDLRTAWLSSSYSQMGTVATELMSGETEHVRPLLTELAKLIGSSSNPADSIQLLQSVESEKIPNATRTPVLLALGEGLRRRGTTISATLTTSKANETLKQSLAKYFSDASAIAKETTASEADRLNAIKLLALADAGLAESSLVDLLTPQTPSSLQLAAVKSLSAHGTDAAFSLMIDSWKSFGPGTRREIVDNLVQSTRGAMLLINAIQKSTIKIGKSNATNDNCFSTILKSPYVMLPNPCWPNLSATGNKWSPTISRRSS